MENKERILCQNNLFDTNNLVLDRILSEKTAHAKTKNISIKTEIYLKSKLDITELAWCSLMENALDNAIEVCENVQGKKTIFIGMKNRGNNLAIMIRNSCVVTHNSNEEIIIDTKMEAEKYGMGIKRIKKVVNDYNGIMKIEHNKEEFCLKLLLCGV